MIEQTKQGKRLALIGLSALLMAVVMCFAGCENDPAIEYQDRVYNPYADLAWKGDLPEDATVSIGTAKYNIGGQGRVRYEETALGNLVADGMAVSARNISGQTIDFAFLNGQNFQSQTTILKGAIYQSSLSGLTDVLHVATFTAKDIFGIFDTLISSDAYESTGSGWKRNSVLVVSKEVSYIIDNSTNPPHVSEIKVNGVAIGKEDEATTFRVATGNFFTTGNFSNSGIKPYNNTENEGDPDNVFICTDNTVKIAVLKYIYAKGTIEPAIEGRIVGTVPVNATTN